MSTTYIATIVAFLSLGLPAFGITIADEGSLTDNVTKIVGVVSTLWILYGRYRAGGINAFGLRTK